MRVTKTVTFQDIGLHLDASALCTRVTASRLTYRFLGITTKVNEGFN